MVYDLPVTITVVTRVTRHLIGDNETELLIDGETSHLM